MPRESDRNKKTFHKGHYEIIAARFREQVSQYQNDEGETHNLLAATAVRALEELAESLSARFKFDNEDHDPTIFMERCGFVERG